MNRERRGACPHGYVYPRELCPNTACLGAVSSAWIDVYAAQREVAASRASPTHAKLVHFRDATNQKLCLQPGNVYTDAVESVTCSGCRCVLTWIGHQGMRRGRAATEQEILDDLRAARTQCDDYCHPAPGAEPGTA